MSKYTLFVRSFSYSIFLILVFFVTNCATAQKEWRAYIDENPYWTMVESCGYEGCLPIVDFLTGKDLTIRIELNEDSEKRYFVILIAFMSVKNQYEFKPSEVLINVNKKVLNVKALNGANLSRKADYLWTEPSILGSVKIKDLNGFLLFVNRSVPEVGEEVVMNMNNTLTLNGKKISVPQIYFRRHIGKQ